MGKVDLLEKEVTALEKEFKTEVEHTLVLKREVEELVEEVIFLKEALKSKLEKQPTGQIVMEGWLEKKGAIRHNWLRRWFVLESKKALIYYEKKGDTEPKGIIPLSGATCYARVEKNKKPKPLFFNIRTMDRDFLIRAETKEIKDMWVKAIKENTTKLSEGQKQQLQKKGSSLLLGHVVADQKQ